jgi:Uma2 family endonuclease
MVQAQSTLTTTLTEFLRLPNLEESPAWELVDQIVSQKPSVLRENSVVPDIAVLARDRMPIGNQPLKGSPESVIEILSPDQSTTKLIAKIQTCLQEGAQLGWLIDAEEQVVMVLQPGQPLELLRGDDVLSVLTSIELKLTVAQVFGWLPR